MNLDILLDLFSFHLAGDTLPSSRDAYHTLPVFLDAGEALGGYVLPLSAAESLIDRDRLVDRPEDVTEGLQRRAAPIDGELDPFLLAVATGVEAVAITHAERKS